MDASPARMNIGQLPQGRFMAHGELQVWRHGRLLLMKPLCKQVHEAGLPEGEWQGLAL